MSDKLSFDSQERNDQLAEFTDRLLRGADVEMMLAEEDQDLYELQQTVLKFHQLAGVDRPGEALAQRIQANLAAEWRRLGLGTQPETLWQRGWRKLNRQQPGWQSSRRQQRVYALVLAVAVVILLILSLPFISLPQENLPGTAGGSLVFIAIIITLVLILSSLVWWYIRRK